MHNSASQRVPTAGLDHGRGGLQGRRVDGGHRARWGLPRGLLGGLLGLLGRQALFVAVHRPLGRLLRPGRSHKPAGSGVCDGAGSHGAPETGCAGKDARNTDERRDARAQEAYGVSCSIEGPHNSPSLYRLAGLQRSFSHRNIFVGSPDVWAPGNCPQGLCGRASVNGCLRAWPGPGLGHVPGNQPEWPMERYSSAPEAQLPCHIRLKIRHACLVHPCTVRCTPSASLKDCLL